MAHHFWNFNPFNDPTEKKNSFLDIHRRPSVLMFRCVNMLHWRNVTLSGFGPSQTIIVEVETYSILSWVKIIGMTSIFYFYVRLRSYMDLCILVPGISTQHGSGSSEQVSIETPLSDIQLVAELIWSCATLCFFNERDMNEQIVASFHEKCSGTPV